MLKMNRTIEPVTLLDLLDDGGVAASLLIHPDDSVQPPVCYKQVVLK